MGMHFYSTARWRRARDAALRRDGNVCLAGRLLGGECSSVLHVHHKTRPEDGGAPYALSNLVVVCSAHHPQLEALRRFLARRDRTRVRCPHRHAHLEARLLCEARMTRERERVAA